MRRLVSWFTDVLRNRRRKTNLPRFLTYTVSFSCNARCIMCDSWKIPSKEDLTFPEIERIVDQLPPMDAVRLTGGEPFVRKDMADIAHLMERKLKPWVVSVTTNGFLTERIVEFVRDPRRKVPLDLLVSIDGLEDKHNTIRGHSQAYHLCLETLKALAPHRKALKLRLSVNQTIVDEEGVEQYKLLREALKPLGVVNKLVMAYDVSATYNLERNIEVAPKEIGDFATFGDFSQEKIRELLDEAERDLPNLPWADRLAKRYYLKGLRSRLLHDEGTPNPKCVALSSHLRIFPNGDVPTCQFNSKIAGNLREQSFDEIWNSAQADKQRDWVRKCPGCWAECEVVPSAIYTGDLFRAFLRGKGSYRPIVPRETVQFADSSTCQSETESQSVELEGAVGSKV